jgi:2-phospho-L-lactate guanylyltransferase
MWVVVPCKSLDRAKSRLASVLSAMERRNLVLAMLTDVLDTLTKSNGLQGIVVTSSDPAISVLVASYDAEWFSSDCDKDLSSALSSTSRFLEQREPNGVMVVPGDIPLLSVSDIAAAVEMTGSVPSVMLAPDNLGFGTNLLAMSSTGLMPYSFGTDSFRRHRSAARACGIEPIIIETPSLGLDIDTPADLCMFMENASQTYSYDYLIDSGIRERLIEKRETTVPLANVG